MVPYWTTSCQGVPSLPRKEIVKNIAPRDASEISFSFRVALGSGLSTESGRGSLCPKTKQITTIPGMQLVASDYSSLCALVA
jgi:hypothetical protein